MFRCFNITLTHAETEKLISENDEDESGEIDFSEFCVMMSKIIMQKEVDPELHEAYRVFNQFEGEGIDA